LGDDDYISKDYLFTVINIITSHSGITCVVPSFVPIDANGERLGGGRDINSPTRRYSSGFLTARKLMDKGHQLSGISFLRRGTLSAYEKANQPNLYPFMFFVGFNCLRGECVHLTDFPVRVSVGAKKDWGYGEDGLLRDIFKNTSMLFKNPIKQGIVELTIFRRQTWRWTRYFGNGPRDGLAVLSRIISCKHVSVVTKIGLWPIVGAKIGREAVRKFLSYLNIS
jgi:hypothetical protein